MTEKQLNIILHKDVILQEIKDKYITYVVIIAREWLNKGYDIRPYLDNDFNAVFYSIMLSCLEKGIKFDQYLHLSSQRFLEVIKGLDAGVDVSIYADEKFDCWQMEQIRLGLEQGLNVESYANADYSDYSMIIKRNHLLRKRKQNDSRTN